MTGTLVRTDTGIVGRVVRIIHAEDYGLQPGLGVVIRIHGGDEIPAYGHEVRRVEPASPARKAA